MIGSGGSNRIRTAILQNLVNTLNFRMTLEDAVSRPRIHCEEGLLSIEPGCRRLLYSGIEGRLTERQYWQGRNMLFGGVHAVEIYPARRRFSGVGDPHRDGVVIQTSDLQSGMQGCLGNVSGVEVEKGDQELGAEDDG